MDGDAAQGSHELERRLVAEMIADEDRRPTLIRCAQHERAYRLCNCGSGRKYLRDTLATLNAKIPAQLAYELEHVIEDDVRHVRSAMPVDDQAGTPVFDRAPRIDAEQQLKTRRGSLHHLSSGPGQVESCSEYADCPALLAYGIERGWTQDAIHSGDRAA